VSLYINFKYRHLTRVVNKVVLKHPGEIVFKTKQYIKIKEILIFNK